MVNEFKEELKVLLEKYGYEGVMYNIRLQNMRRKDFSLQRDADVAYGDGSVIMLDNIFKADDGQSE